MPVNDIQSGYDFAYDYREQSIYWLEHNSSFSSVDTKKVKFDGEDRTTLVSNDLVDHEHFDAVFTFEFDAASRNLFVGNMFQSQIEVRYSTGKTAVFDSRNVKIPQSMAVARFAAKKVNLYGSDDLEQAKTDAVVDTVNELMNAYFQKIRRQTRREKDIL